MNAAVRRPMASKIHRIITGDYVSPGGPDHDAGERVVTVAYLVNHPDARILFDTGFPLDAPFSVTEGGHELVTYPRSILITLDTMGVALDAIDAVVNCHLHIDHAGGNFRMPPELLKLR